eukprot:TRINITY_DN5960_c0_g1_i2.p1 TRINITY_DN5960_c0_g1~~TRINITY_DN5960_c0_g1_i2.p1  ORF type:complete len:446 (+),score=32.76 TRINITY_DN5960_c0_g1_i2:13-1350(+)
MMAQLKVQLLDGGVFYEGFQIAARATISNGSDSTLALAWVSAQVYCQCTYNKTRVKLTLPRRPTKQTYAFNPTSGAVGTCVYESEPRVLACDVHLEPQETRTYECHFQLPRGVPPTHKGDAMSFNHQLAVGAGLFDNTAHVARVPFRVLPVSDELLRAAREGSQQVLLPSYQSKPEQRDDAVENIIHLPSLIPANSVRTRLSNQATRDSTGATSPFAAGQDQQEPDVAAAEDINPFAAKPRQVVLKTRDISHGISCLSRRRRACHYKLNTSSGSAFAVLTLPKRRFRLGEDITGTFRFLASQGQEDVPSCLKLAVGLQRKETIGTGARVDGLTIKESTNMVVLDAQQIPTINAMNAAFTLSAPMVAAPSFYCDFVGVGWVLSFEFALSKSPPQALLLSTPEGDVLPPTQVSASLMSWQMPIVIVPAAASQVPHRVFSASVDLPSQ